MKTRYFVMEPVKGDHYGKAGRIGMTAYANYLLGVAKTIEDEDEKEDMTTFANGVLAWVDEIETNLNEAG